MGFLKLNWQNYSFPHGDPYDFSGFFLEIQLNSKCLLPSCSELRVLGSARPWPHPGLRQLGRGHLPADLHRAGPVGSEEDQQRSHCKSTPCLRPRHVSAVCSLERGRSGGHASGAEQTQLGEQVWASLRWSRTEATSREARLHLPHSAQSSAGAGSFRSGRARALQGGTSSLPACRPCCAQCTLSWPAVTAGTPGPEWGYKEHRRKLVLCFLCKVETVRKARWTVVGGIHSSWASGVCHVILTDVCEWKEKLTNVQMCEVTSPVLILWIEEWGSDNWLTGGTVLG